MPGGIVAPVPPWAQPGSLGVSQEERGWCCVLSESSPWEDQGRNFRSQDSSRTLRTAVAGAAQSQGRLQGSVGPGGSLGPGGISGITGLGSPVWQLLQHKHSLAPRLCWLWTRAGAAGETGQVLHGAAGGTGARSCGAMAGAVKVSQG